VAFLFLAFFIIGSAVGSFLNVVIDRVAKGESVVFGRSYCDHCHATLSSVDLIPIVSFVGLGGRCRYCKKKISRQYPLVEALTGILFVLTFYYSLVWQSFSLVNLVYYLFILCTLIVVFVIDLKFSLIPTTFVFAASLLALLRNYFYLNSYDFVIGVVSAFGIAASFLAVVFVTRGRGMGTGDIPLVFLLALFLGWPNNLAAVFLAFVAGAVVSLALLFAGKKKFGQTIPFGPFLIAGAVAVFFWGERLISWYLGFL